VRAGFSDGFTGLKNVYFQAADVLRELPDLFGPAYQLRKRSEVHRDHMANVQEPNRHRRFARPHRKVITNRQQRHVRRVQFRDQLHVAEERSVAGVIDRQAAGKPQDVAASFSAINDVIAVEYAAGMHGVNHRHFDFADFPRAAFVHRVGVLHAF
jgi:hypothetical protein